MSFSLDLSAFSELAEDKMVAVVQKSFIGLSSDIIKDTPVLKGRLRGNWIPAINKFDDSQLEVEDKTGDKTIAKTISEANKFKLGDTMTLSNNMPYAERIEFEGWSKKAPEGMVRKNIVRWNKEVEKIARSLK